MQMRNNSLFTGFKHLASVRLQTKMFLFSHNVESPSNLQQSQPSYKLTLTSSSYPVFIYFPKLCGFFFQLISQLVFTIYYLGSSKLLLAVFEQHELSLMLHTCSVRFVASLILLIPPLPVQSTCDAPDLFHV